MDQLSGRFLYVTVVLFTSFIAATYGFGIYLFPAIAPEMIKDIGFTYAQMGVTTGAVQAGFMGFALLSGVLTGWLGAFNVIRISIVLCAAALGGLTWAENFVLISVCLFLLGGCAASVWVPMVEVSQQCISRLHQGRVLGLMSSGTSYGVFMNSLLIALLLNAYGWRSLWIVTFALVCGLCVWAFFVLRKLEQGLLVDRTPQAVQAPQAGLVSKIRSLPAGTTSLVLVMMFLNGLSCMPYQTYLSSFLVGEHGFSIEQSALAWRIIGLVGMAGGFLMGWVADRITVKWALTIVYSILSLAALVLLVQDLSIVHLYVTSVLFGLSFYAIFGLVPAYISHVYRNGTAALVFSFGNVALGFGGIAGNLAGGWLKETSGTFEWIYVVILAAAIGSVVVSLAMRNERFMALQMVDA